MNKKGFVLSSSVFALMLITASIIYLSYRPILNNSNTYAQSKGKLLQNSMERNAVERMHGRMTNNPYLSGTLNFEDLGIVASFINVERPVETTTIEAKVVHGAGDVSLDMDLTADTVILIKLDYTAEYNGGVEYPPGLSRYSWKLIHETLGEVVVYNDNGTPLANTDIIGEIEIPIDPTTMPIGTYTIIVIPPKGLDVMIEAKLEVTLADQKVLEIRRDGELIHSQIVE